jgi:hypothetical protein
MSYSCLGSAVKCMFSKAAMTAPAWGLKRERLRICALRDAQQAWRTSRGYEGFSMSWRQSAGENCERRCYRSGDGEWRKRTSMEASSA